MVHHWVSLQNNKIKQVCDNKKILNIFKDVNTYFYGDYDLDIFMLSKNEDKKTDVYTMAMRCDCDYRNDRYDSNFYHLSEIINKFGEVSPNNLKKIFPKRETMKITKSITMQDDGNFVKIACETERFYYLLCFSTS